MERQVATPRVSGIVAGYVTEARLFSRDVRLFLVTSVLFGFTAYGGTYTVLLNLYLLRLGYGTEFVGLISATGQLAFPSLACSLVRSARAGAIAGS